MDWWIVALALGEFALIGWILWVVSSYKTRKSKERSEERMRILERFSSQEELSRFLASDAGGNLFANPKSSSPRPWLVTGLTLGVVSLFVGLGGLVLAGLNIFHDRDTFLIWGVLLGFTGTGILVSVAVSVGLLRRLNGDAS